MNYLSRDSRPNVIIHVTQEGAHNSACLAAVPHIWPQQLLFGCAPAGLLLYPRALAIFLLTDEDNRVSCGDIDMHSCLLFH